MLQGVRSSKAGKNRAGSFQPGVLLELVVYEQPNKNMQRIREFQAACIYTTLNENVIKNSVALFSVELLLRLLPEHAPLPVLFDFVYDYFTRLDKMPVNQVANFPLYFIIHCSRISGYELKGAYSSNTPHLDLHEGGFTDVAPVAPPYMPDEDAKMMGLLQQADDYESLDLIQMNADMRVRLIDWYITFLQQHTQHMGNIRSLAVLRAILH